MISVYVVRVIMKVIEIIVNRRQEYTLVESL